MKQQFQETNFRPATLETIDRVNDIIADYQADGMKLTLRQLYYQFVSRDWIPNTKQSYDNLGAVVSNGRLAGLIDWRAIEDRTRFLRGRQNYNSPAEMIEYQARTYTIPMWENQDTHLEVWIEKDALLGVIENTCRSNDVDYFACRGYVSQSELYHAGQRLGHIAMQGQQVVVIHLGDHDPSGIDMTRDNMARLQMFSGDSENVTLRRIALDMNQIEEYAPPPNIAKLTDARAKGYIEKYGYSSWELDALEPRVMQRLIQDTIDEYKDPYAWDDRMEIHAEHKEVLNEVVAGLENSED